jgi:amino acid transporter
MGRDGVLSQRLFGAVHDRFHTPWLSITAVGVVGLLAVFLDVATSTSFINFGAFVAFTAVNIAVIALWWQRRRDGEQLSVLGYVIAPAIGAVIIVTLLVRLDANAVLIGLGWLALGTIILGISTSGFRRQPPEMTIDEVQTVGVGGQNGRLS